MIKKYENLSDEVVCKVVSKELKRFMNLIKGHEKLLMAIAKL